MTQFRNSSLEDYSPEENVSPAAAERMVEEAVARERFLCKEAMCRFCAGETAYSAVATRERGEAGYKHQPTTGNRGVFPVDCAAAPIYSREEKEAEERRIEGLAKHVVMPILERALGVGPTRPEDPAVWTEGLESADELLRELHTILAELDEAVSPNWLAQIAGVRTKLSMAINARGRQIDHMRLQREAIKDWQKHIAAMGHLLGCAGIDEDVQAATRKTLSTLRVAREKARRERGLAVREMATMVQKLIREAGPGADVTLALKIRERIEAAAAAPREMPWGAHPLDKWSICGMNHYYVRCAGLDPGVSNPTGRHLFVAMAKEGMVIKAEGQDEFEVFESLAQQAASVEKADKEHPLAIFDPGFSK